MALFSEAGEQEVEIVSGGLNLFGKDGSRYAIPIPAPLSEVFYLPDGLLLKCKSQQSFHHSQVLGEESAQLTLYTYLTLVQHPYSDLYPLGSMNNFLWTSTEINIIFSTKRFPIIIGYDPSKSGLFIYLLRTNLVVIEEDKEDLLSLEPSGRDDLYLRHIGSTPLIVAESLYKVRVNSEIDQIEVAVPSNYNGK